jgi:hypothetical protein
MSNTNPSFQQVNNLNRILIESFEVYDKIKKNYDRNYENYNKMVGELNRLEGNILKQKEKIESMEKVLSESLNSFYKAENEYKYHHINYLEASKQYKRNIIDSKIREMNDKIESLKFEKENL